MPCSKCKNKVEPSSYTHAYCRNCKTHITYIKLDGGAHIFGDSDIDYSFLDKA